MKWRDDMKKKSNMKYFDEDFLRMRKFFNKQHAIHKQQILKKKGIKTKIIKTTKINSLFPKKQQKRLAYKVVRAKWDMVIYIKAGNPKKEN